MGRIKSSLQNVADKVGFISKLRRDKKSKESKEADSVYKKFAGKSRKMERVAGTKFISSETEEITFNNLFIGDRKASAVLNSSDYIDEFCTHLKKIRSELGKASNLLNATESNSEINETLKEYPPFLKETLKGVQNELIQLNNLSKELNFDGKDILEATNFQTDFFNAAKLPEVIDKALIGTESLLSIIKKKKPGLLSRLNCFSTSKVKSKNKVGENELVLLGKNNKLFANIPYYILRNQLFIATMNNDIEFVRNVLEYHSEDIKTYEDDAKKLSNLALGCDKKGYIIQLLVNKELFTVDDLEEDLRYKISTVVNSDNTRLTRLLTTIQNRDKLCAIVPLTAIGENTKQSLDNRINKLIEYINKNDTDKIKAMIRLGHIDLLGLNDEDLFSILENTAKKIKSKTMKLLLENGFDISSAKNSENRDVFSIIDKFRDSVLKVLKNRNSSHALFKSKIFDTARENSRYYADKGNLGLERLDHYVSEDNLKAVKILFKNFNASTDFNRSVNWSVNLKTAIRHKNVAMVEYLLGQLNKILKDDCSPALERTFKDILIDMSSSLANDQNLNKKDLKAATRIATLIEKKFKVASDETNNYKTLKNVSTGKQYEILKKVLDTFSDDEYCIKALEMLKNKEINFKAKNYLGDHILFHATMYQSKDEIVQWLIEQVQDDKDLLNAKHDRYKETLLHHAVKNNASNIVKSLLNAGADRSIEDNYSKTPLDFARQFKHQEIIKLLDVSDEIKTQLLIKKFKQFVKESENISEDIKEMFNADEVNLQNIPQNMQYNILYIASEFDTPDILEYLKSIKINFTASNKDDENILMKVAEDGKTAMLEWLLKNIQDYSFINAKNGCNYSSLSLAVKKKHPDTVELLLKYGADFTIKSSSGETLLQRAKKRAENPTRREENQKIIELLEEAYKTKPSSGFIIYKPEEEGDDDEYRDYVP